jgi:hypothetical protein
MIGVKYYDSSYAKILRNANCADEFDISSTEPSVIEAGTVMVISNDGRLQISFNLYNRRVAGDVSDAGNLKPVVVLGNKKAEKSRVCIPWIC